MSKFTVTVYDQRGRHDHGVYEVEGENHLDAYGLAIDLFVNEKGLKPYKCGTSSSRYYSQFYVTLGNDPQPEPNPVKVKAQGDKYLGQVRSGRMGAVALAEGLEKLTKGHDGRFQRAVLDYVKAGL